MKPIPLTCVPILTVVLTPLAWNCSTPVRPELVGRIGFHSALRVGQESAGMEELRQRLIPAQPLGKFQAISIPAAGMEELRQLQENIGPAASDASAETSEQLLQSAGLDRRA